ncbi:ABC transporter permease [Bianquea renquensis]
MKQHEPALAPKKKSKFARVDKSLYLMLIPGAVILIIYSYIPIFGLQIAFKDFDIAKGIWGSPWVGLDNFKYIFFSYPGFGKVVFNTVYIAVLKMIFRYITPIIVALLLNEVMHIKFKRTVQTLIYLPHFISWIVICGLMISILSPTDGAVNEILKAVGLKPVYFLGNKSTFRPVLIISDVWKEFGYGTIIYMAALTSIDPSLYEAATIDRANRFQKVLYITLPGIAPIAVLVGILGLGSLLSAGFDQIFNLYNPLVYDVADVLDTFTYRMGILNAQYDLSTAVSFVTSFTNAGLVLISYFIAYKVAGYRPF